MTAPAGPGQGGVALITVLLVVFLATVAAASLATVQQFAIRRSELLLHRQQAMLYARGAEDWARQILARDDLDKDHLEEDWAALPPALPVEGGTITGAITDLQSRFNLNNLLSDPVPDENGQDTWPAEQALARLLRVLELDPAIAQAVGDWIDADLDPRFSYGAEDGEYVAREPPYHTANRPMLDVSELRLVKGVDAEVYAKLAPYVSALPLAAADPPERPPPTPINVNTVADPEVLSALSEALEDKYMNLLEDRPPDGWDDGAFQERADLQAQDLYNTGVVAVNSQWFQVRVEALVGEGRATLTSVLRRTVDQTTGKVRVRVLTRSHGNPDH